VYIFFWSKADDPPNKPTPKNQVKNLDPEIRLIRRKIRYAINTQQQLQNTQMRFWKKIYTYFIH